MENLKNEIEKLIRERFNELAEYHQDTFNFEDFENNGIYHKPLTGEEIYDFTSDTEMQKTEDAYYLMGKIEAYKEILGKIKPLEINFTMEDLQELMDGEDFNWTFEGIDVHLYNEEVEDEEN